MLLAAFCLAAGLAAQPSGSYDGADWIVNGHRTLVWNGAPYLPVGWRLQGDPDVIRRAAQTGLKDALLELPPNGWDPAIEAAESAGLRYLVTPNEPAPRAPAFLIRPQSYRIQNAEKDGEYRIPLPGGRSVYYLLLTNQNFSIADKGWTDVIDGVATVRLNVRYASRGYLLLVYPRLIRSEMTDYWERFDARRDELLGRLRDAPFGPGLRGIVNPLGRVEQWTPARGGLVPDSELFRLEFRAYLETKYRNVDRLTTAWRMRVALIDSFEAAARLVALFSHSRGLDRLWDPQNDIFIPVDRSRSAYWSDVQTVIENAASRRTRRLAASIRRVLNVPVVYEWKGWSPVYGSAEPSGDGLGMTAVGTGLQPTEKYAAYAASTMLSWGHKGWLLATDLAASEDGGPYPEERYLRSAILDTVELGAKGWFVRWTGGPETEWLPRIAAEMERDASLAVRSLRALFYPENARHPANTMRLPGGTWWLPTPAAGNRLDLGDRYEAYRHVAPFATFTAIWRPEGEVRVRLLMKEPEKATVVSFDGNPVEVKVRKDSLELLLGPLPTLIMGTDEIPVPSDALDSVKADYRALVKEAQRKGVDIGDSQFMFNYEADAKRFKANPGASFTTMVEELRKIQRDVGAFIWVEGESVKSEATNFGYLEQTPGCSGEESLVLDTTLRPDTNGYYATYRFIVRQDVQDAELWIAARVPEEVRSSVTIEVRGGATLQLPDYPEAGYGPGYAWYRVGNLLLRPGMHEITVRVWPGAPYYQVAIDALLLIPVPFKPSGPRLPPVIAR
ncbi:MAG: hypothetical protein IH851_00265 [Armatimonadetes bacterium]|nr:hypothetical protein [Armatimonadota bacterium]